MKKNLDKFLKYITITINNFLIKISVRIFLPQKIHADENFYLNKFHELKTFSKKNINLKIEFDISDDFILPLALKTVVVKKKSKLSIDHGKYLYSELRKYICNNNFDFINVVETGTARGFSAICMAKAMYDEKQNGQIFTFDILPHDKKLYWNNILDVTQGKATRKELLQEWNYLTERYIKFINNFAHIYLKSINFERVHFAFFDGSHYAHDIKYEFEKIALCQMKNDISIFDDFNELQYNDMYKLILDITKKYNYNHSIIRINDNRKILLAKKI